MTHSLTVSSFLLGKGENHNVRECITQFKISAQMGNLQGSEFGSGTTHYIALQLKDGKMTKGKIEGPAYNDRDTEVELNFPRNLLPQIPCIKRSDIKQVKLVAGGKDNWYITKSQPIPKLEQNLMNS